MYFTHPPMCVCVSLLQVLTDKDMMWSARLPQTTRRRSININQVIMLNLITKKKDKKD